jgi:hypothetical protein
MKSVYTLLTGEKRLRNLTAIIHNNIGQFYFLLKFNKFLRPGILILMITSLGLPVFSQSYQPNEDTLYRSEREKIWYESIKNNNDFHNPDLSDPIILAPAGSIRVNEDSPYDDYTPEELVQNVLVTGCLQASNVTFQGQGWDDDDEEWESSNRALGYFHNNGTDFPLDSGLILSTGLVHEAEGPNDNWKESTDNNEPGDSDLTLISGYNTYDAAILEFDFIPAGNTIEFKYTFASEEYLEWSCSEYNDAFGFFLSGGEAGGDYGVIAGGQGFDNDAVNIAFLPNDDPVTINNVHGYFPATTWYQYSWDECPANNEMYYVDNGDGHPDSTDGGLTMQFDGRTIVLTATYNVDPCEEYHIKLSIADVSDEIWDAGVFLEARSFISNDPYAENHTPIGISEDVYEGCLDNELFFIRSDIDDTEDQVTINLTYSGTATIGTDVSNTFPSSLTILPGDTAASIPYEVYYDNDSEGTEELIINITGGCPCGNGTSSYYYTINVNDHVEIESITHEDVTCYGNTDGSITVTAGDGLGPYTFTLVPEVGAEQILQGNPSVTFNNLSGGDYTVEVEDLTQCVTETSQTIVITQPAQEIEISVDDKTDASCPGEEDGSATVSASGGTPPYQYQWDDPANQTGPTASNLGAGTYIVTVSDANNCGATQQVVIDDDDSDPPTITCPTDISVDADPVNCNPWVIVPPPNSR